MSSEAEIVNVTLHLDAGAGADPDELDALARQLQNEIAQELNVEKVELMREGPIEPGAKAGEAEALMLGAMAVTLLPTTLTNLFNLLRDWSSRGKNQNVKVTARIGDQEVIIEYPSTPSLHDDLSRLLNAVLSGRESAATARTRSGGANIDAGEVEIGGDVVGRDMTVGGHYIRADAGATVIVNPPPQTRSAPQPMTEPDDSSDEEYQ